MATAGSCFAQHLSRHLKEKGFTFLVTEPGHAAMSEDALAAANYGVFSARFGNLYTSRQLLQLLRRAYGEFVPADDVWKEGDGFVDPYRPAIQPGGFRSMAEYQLDRERHFAAVRRLVEETDVFVFTLGLTECWENKQDGAVYPLCPGVSGGRFDRDQHRFRNLTVHEVVSDLDAVLAILASRNPAARMVLTVSPVPLKATASGAHVLAATTYSKAVLRVAAETISARYKNVGYFPSYEIITGPAARGRYYAEDLRSVTDEGVAHVMRVFLSEATTVRKAPAPRTAAPTAADTFVSSMEKVTALICEEEALGADRNSAPKPRPRGPRLLRVIRSAASAKD